jgi:hypothetical protein
MWQTKTDRDYGAVAEYAMTCALCVVTVTVTVTAEADALSVRRLRRFNDLERHASSVDRQVWRAA